jgi:hypothetical protein
VGGSEAITTGRATLTASEIFEFLETLRPAPGTHQLIMVQELLAGLAARQVWPEGGREFRELLAPIVCSSAEEQDAFYREFDARWAKGERQKREERLTVEQNASAREPRRPRVWRRRAAMYTPLAVLVIAAIVWQPKPPGYSGPTTGPTGPPPPAVSAVTIEVEARDAKGPVPGIAVYSGHQHYQTGPDGVVTLPGGAGVAPFYVLLTHDRYAPVLVRIDAKTTARA